MDEQNKIELLKEKIESAQAIVVGIASGMSARSSATGSVEAEISISFNSGVCGCPSQSQSTDILSCFYSLR